MLDKLKVDWDTANVATILIAVLTVLAGIIGGLVVLIDSDTLDFQSYLTLMAGFAGAVGLLGIGRGIGKVNKPLAPKSGADAGPTTRVQHPPKR
jgi:hypothetical protein